MVTKFHVVTATLCERHQAIVFSMFLIFTVTAAASAPQYGLTVITKLQVYHILALTIQNVNVAFADFTESVTVSQLGLTDELKFFVF